MVENSGPHLSGQSLMDIAVQEYGAVSQVFELVRANGLRGITDNVWAGDELVIPAADRTDSGPLLCKPTSRLPPSRTPTEPQASAFGGSILN